MAEDEITLPAAAAASGVKLRTLQAAVTRRHLAARKLGRDWLTTLAAVEQWRTMGKHHPGPAKRQSQD